VEQTGDIDATRRGNVMARERMIVLFDLSAKYKSAPDRHEQQSERFARLLHVARRRHAAREPAGRSVQDPGAAPLARVTWAFPR